MSLANSFNSDRTGCSGFIHVGLRVSAVVVSSGAVVTSGSSTTVKECLDRNQDKELGVAKDCMKCNQP